MLQNNLDITVQEILWDVRNVLHIARHAVIPDEVEESINERTLYLPSYSGRIMAIGETKQKRVLASVLQPDRAEEIYYVVTARSASRKERKEYDTYKKIKTHSRVRVL